MQRLLQPPTSPPIPGRKRSVRTKPFEQAVMMRNTRRNVRKAAIELEISRSKQKIFANAYPRLIYK